MVIEISILSTRQTIFPLLTLQPLWIVVWTVGEVLKSHRSRRNRRTRSLRDKWRPNSPVCPLRARTHARAISTSRRQTVSAPDNCLPPNLRATTARDGMISPVSLVPPVKLHRSFPAVYHLLHSHQSPLRSPPETIHPVFLAGERNNSNRKRNLQRYAAGFRSKMTMRLLLLPRDPLGEHL